MTLKYQVGIDLGTTNIVVAYADKHSSDQDICLFKIPQIIQPGRIAKLTLLPSVRYVDNMITNHPEDYRLPWMKQNGPVIGAYAKERAGEHPENAVISPKSWLAHPVLDIEQPLLPIGSLDEAVKVSPVEAIKEQLAYIKAAWNHQFELYPLEQQSLAVTIPASFDDKAREVIKRSLEALNIQSFYLLEEPQAAFYNWLSEHDDFSNIAVESEMRSMALVCDVGGGTTDFSLIVLYIRPEGVAFERIATGDHLLLGGDNMDLLLSYYLQKKYQVDIPAYQQAQWLMQIRTAKEKLLKNPDLDSASVTLLSKSSRLLANKQQYSLTQQEVVSLILDGFVPEVALAKSQKTSSRSGLRRISLPYETNSAITQHLADFLIDNQAAMREALLDYDSQFVMPEVILFNGGVFYSNQIQQRLLHTFEQWRQGGVEVLENYQPSLAVAKGAVYYLQAISGQGVAIHSSAPNNYFLKTHDNQLVCILTKGSQTNKQYMLNQSFLLRVNQPVSFEIYSSKINDAQHGQIINDQQFDDLVKQFELVTQISHQKDVQVKLRVHYSSIGLIAIEAIDEKQQVYSLNFTRSRSHAITSAASDHQGVMINIKHIESTIKHYFKSNLKLSLREAIQQQTGSLDKLSIKPLRQIADVLIRYYADSRKSAVYERSWWNVTGYCLRPGVGDVDDQERIKVLWKKYTAGVRYKCQQNYAEFWIFWRRVVGGLSVLMQEKIFTDIKNIIYTRKDQLSARHLLGYIEKMRLISSLEKITISKKVDVGHFVVRQVQRKVEDSLLWWMLGRLANRALYACSVEVIPVDVVQDWIDQVLRLPIAPSFRQQAAKALVLIGQKTGDPMIDLDQAHFERISTTLSQWGIKKNTIDCLYHGLKQDKEMFDYAMGESLPAGLVLLEG